MESSQAADVIIISDEELKSLTDAIHQRHGIDFSCYEPNSLKRRVVRSLHIFKLQAAHELWIKILKDRSFIYPFMDEISVGLTSMFRDPVLWRKLRQMLKEDLIKNANLSIWHAGCSTGEEVYTMGIVLRESFYSGPVAALATDISNHALSSAQAGIYSVMKMDEYERNYTEFNPSSSLKRYFTSINDSVTFDKTLINHVTFCHHNLITDTFHNRFDVIFCRNVMLYFDTNAKRGLFDKFYDALNPGGLLIIGFYDAVLPLVDPNKFKVLDMASKIFQKMASKH